jgi:hypothetical protein
MNDFIFNVLPTQGATIPMWVPLLGGFPINSPLVGSFLGVSFAFVMNWALQTWNSKSLIFEEEYYIKSELSTIVNDLRAGGIPLPIKVIYGADHVRKYRLFGEHRTLAIYWYDEFIKYNFEYEELQKQRLEACMFLDRDNITSIFDSISDQQKYMAKRIDVMLKESWLKRIPDDMSNSGLSTTKFVWYLLNQDALEEPTKNKDYWYAAVNKLLRRNKKIEYAR